ncbi:MAG: triosephosphate isomerase [Methylobacteriaceae bacterium]|jgi:triosephosphate isomerase|nr:triosephosphate isomerase [Methylobacteriaceae bacterium]
MTIREKPLVAGNWKMNGSRASLAEIAAIRDAVGKGGAGRAQVLVCPPATLISTAADLCKDSALAIGAQDCHRDASGAHTGDISAEILRDAGATYVIVGHSERRADHGESDEVVRAKAEAVLRAGLTPIICVGETKAQREAGETLPVVGAQLEGSVPHGTAGERLVIAYEPVWAIGTGLTPSTDDVAEVHGFVRRHLSGIVASGAEKVRILYGGSVKPSNAAELIGVADVDGALVGGASLKAADFMAIAAAYR